MATDLPVVIIQIEDHIDCLVRFIYLRYDDSLDWTTPVFTVLSG